MRIGIKASQRKMLLQHSRALLLPLLFAVCRVGAEPAPTAARSGDANLQLCDWQRGKHTALCPNTSSCVALPQDIQRGACFVDPDGGNRYPQDSVVGKRVMYFPLTAGSLASWPWATRTGTLVSVAAQAAATAGVDASSTAPTPAAAAAAWQPDGRFNSTFVCDGATQVVIPSIPYGRTGAFTVAFWFKRSLQPIDAARNNLYEYLFSHRNSGPNEGLPWGRNQVQIFLLGRPLGSIQGLARAVVKDSNDGSDSVFLDTDGSISDSTRMEPIGGWSGGNTNLSDGSWHHLALTTQPDGSLGYRVYIDGNMAAEIPGQDPGPAALSEMDGGDPLIISGPITLCGRNDFSRDRTFNGAISQLMILDSTLDWSEVNQLFRTGAVPEARGQQASDVAVPAPTFYDSTLLLQPTTAASGGSLLLNTSAAAEQAQDQQGAQRGGDVTRKNTNGSGDDEVAQWGASAGSPCTLDLSMQRGLVFCKPGLVCSPIHRNKSSSSGGGVRRPTGVCAKPVPGILMSSSWPQLWPTPLAYFPLSQATGLFSWPLGVFRGTARYKVKGEDQKEKGKKKDSELMWRGNSRFGSSLNCNNMGGNRSHVTLDAVPYARGGAFAINLWVKTHTKSDLHGDSFAYVYSHTSKSPPENYRPNQVQIFIPEDQNPFGGLAARVIIKDSNDKFVGRPSEVWVDTTGLIGSDNLRDILPDSVHIGDGEWHMITVSTFKGGSQGFAVFLDGLLKGIVNENSLRDTGNTSDTNIQIPGGGPMLLDGPITLCGRSDLDDRRFFSGSISNLMLFDTDLAPSQVAALYQEYQRQAVQYPSGYIPVDRTSVDGQRCVFPASFGGKMVHDCMYLDEILQCPVKETGKWLPCSLNAQYPDGTPITIPTNLTGVADGTVLGPGRGFIPRLSSSGQMCVLPFRHNNVTYDDCAMIDGAHRCLVEDEDPWGTEGYLQECAPIIVRAPQSSLCLSSTDPTSAKAGAQSKTPLLSLCVSLMGVDMCATQDGTWLQCPVSAPRIANNGQACQMPYVLDGLMRSDCVSLLPQDPPPGSFSGSLGGRLGPRSDGPTPAPNPKEGQARASCPVVTGGPGSLLGSVGTLLGLPDLFTSMQMKECQPVLTPNVILEPRFPIRYTINRQQCLAPGPAVLSECLDYGGGAPQCQVIFGGIFDCAPVKRWGKVTNQSCSFPFRYRGEDRTDCVWIAGVEGCMIADGSWEECSSAHLTQFPETPPNATQRFTRTGDMCIAPFRNGENLSWGCVGGDPGYCRIRQGDWQPCSPLETNASRSTTSSQPCELPFLVNGLLSYECVAQHNGFGGVCPVARPPGPSSTPDQVDLAQVSDSLSKYFPTFGGGLEAFLTKMSLGLLIGGIRHADNSTPGAILPCKAPPRRTVSGNACIFPVVYSGRTITDCIVEPAANNTPRCYSDKGQWETCLLTTTQATQEGLPSVATGTTGNVTTSGGPQVMDGATSSPHLPHFKPSHTGLALSVVFGVITGLVTALTVAVLLYRRFRASTSHKLLSQHSGTTLSPAPSHPTTQLSYQSSREIPILSHSHPK